MTTPEADSWLTVQGDGSGMVGLEEARYGVGTLAAPGSSPVTARTGLVPAGSAATPGSVSASATPDGVVHVAPYQEVLQCSRGGGPYMTTLASQKDIDILGPHPADATYDRLDLIVGQQSDTLYGDADSLYVVRHVPGTPASSPTLPTVDGSPDYVERAEILIPAGATSISGTEITNRTPDYTTAAGGVVPVVNAAQRDGIAGAYNGLACWRRDTGWLEVYDGSAWRVRTVPVVTTAELGQIPNPYAGQVALVSDGTGWDSGMELRVYDAATSSFVRYPRDTGWVMVPPTGHWVNNDMQARVKGGVVVLFGRWQRGPDFSYAAVGWDNFGTLPAGIPPPHHQINDWWSGTPTDSDLEGRVMPNGNIDLNLNGANLPANSIISLSMTWPVD